jgi:dihydrofolate reductase
MLSLIVAAAENNAIGKNNELPWHLPNDMKFFKNSTWGSVMIMGRKTFESVKKAFPGRINIVITTQAGWRAEKVVVAANMEEALRLAKETHCNEVFIIGGGEVFKQSMEIADKIYITRVHAMLDGDTFFPEIDPKKWRQTGNLDFEADEKHAYAYSFQTWEKR